MYSPPPDIIKAPNDILIIRRYYNTTFVLHSLDIYKPFEFVILNNYK